MLRVRSFKDADLEPLGRQGLDQLADMLAAAGLTACLVPAFRAMHIDPIDVINR